MCAIRCEYNKERIVESMIYDAVTWPLLDCKMVKEGCSKERAEMIKFNCMGRIIGRTSHRALKKDITKCVDAEKKNDGVEVIVRLTVVRVQAVYGD